METFEYINDSHSRTMLLNAYKAAIKLELRDFFAKQDPPENTGYMFWGASELGKLGAEVDADGHSGSSFSWVCRHLQMYFRDPVAHKAFFVK